MKRFTWKEAQKVVDELNTAQHGGHCNWRLPTITELKSLVDQMRSNPACELPDTVAVRYWSPTTGAGNSVWDVDFRNGCYVYGYNKTYYRYVRAVRSGPNGLEWSETL